MIKRRISWVSLLATVFLSGASGAESMELTDVSLLFKNALEVAAGAPSFVGEEQVGKVKAALEQATVRVEGAVVQNWREPGRVYSGDFCRGGLCCGYETESITDIYKLGGHFIKPSYWSPGQSSGCGRQHAGYSYVLKIHREFPGLKAILNVHVPQNQLRDLRQGQKVSFTMTVYSALGWPGQFELEGTADRIEHELHMLKCGNGHEYAPSSGYKFCPLDGLPVQ